MNKVVSSYKKTCNIIFCTLAYGLSQVLGGNNFKRGLDQNAPSVGNAPFGFWMAQQGSIIIFVLIIVAMQFL